MAELKTISAFVAECLKENQIETAAWSVSETEQREFSTDGPSFALYRTLFNRSFSLTIFPGGRKGSCSCNDLSEAAIRAAVDEAIASAKAAPQDPANGIAPCAGSEIFRHGPFVCEEERFFARAQELLADIKAGYPKVVLLETILSHTAAHTLYCNTNGTEFETFAGYYQVTAGVSGNDGTRSTGFDYCGFVTTSLDTPFIDCSDIRAHLASAEAQLQPVELKGKFTGTVLFTPGCLGSMLEYLDNSFLSGGVVLDGTGMWNDKVGQRVVDERITVTYVCDDPRTVTLNDYTGDGFRRRNFTILDHGVLKGHNMSLYTANKTGREPTCGGASVIMQPGATPYAELLQGIERGILMGAFSGGTPGSNGEMSGVAKNAFYIENGKILGAVTETMISCNLADMFNNVRGLSAETVSTGMTVFPYLAVDGVVISGKDA